jgi:hypothetical protein
MDTVEHRDMDTEDMAMAVIYAYRSNSPEIWYPAANLFGGVCYPSKFV